MWAALDKMGLLISVHETRDNSDGIQSQIGPVSRKYCGRLDDVPEQTAARIEQLGGYVAAVNFTSPLMFPGLDDAGWERLKQPAQWDPLEDSEARALRLLNFIAFDFSDPARAALETLAEDGRLAPFFRRVQIYCRNKWRSHRREMRPSNDQQIATSGEKAGRHRISTN